MNTRSKIPAVCRSLTVFAIAIGLLVAVSGGAAAEPATASATGPDSAAPGETVTISVTISNSGENPGGYVGDVSLPDGWSVSEQTADGAIWNDGDRSWLWQSINAGDSVNPSISVTIPSNETAGSYDIETAVKSNEGIEANATHTIEIQGEAVETTGTENGADANEQENGLLSGIPTLGIIGVVAAVAIVGLVIGRRVL